MVTRSSLFARVSFRAQKVKLKIAERVNCKSRRLWSVNSLVVTHRVSKVPTRARYWSGGAGVSVRMRNLCSRSLHQAL
jgi:hypothetical protein